MKILVISDSHGNIALLKHILSAHHVDMIIHLGDHETDMKRAIKELPDEIIPKTTEIHTVSGNCDGHLLTHASHKILATEYGNILICHGHDLGVKTSINRLYYKAKENDCRLALFGHTHCRFSLMEDGIFLFNPGSITSPRDYMPPSYGIIHMSEKNILARHMNPDDLIRHSSKCISKSTISRILNYSDRF